MAKATIIFNEQEANTLLGLLDMAVKFGGLISAKEAAYFENKLKTAFQQQNQGGLNETEIPEKAD